jgi:tetratricopeptide (TPR) repeat protein
MTTARTIVLTALALAAACRKAPAPPAPATVDAAPPGPAVPATDPLALAWVRWKLEHAPPSAEDRARAAQRRQDAGEVIERQSLRFYAESAEASPEAETYAAWAERLADAGRLEDATRAVEIALELGHPRPDQQAYALATLWSRRHDAARAHAALDRAVASGYSAFGAMREDPRLDWLRAQPGWDERFARWLPALASYTPGDVIGRAELHVLRASEVVALCADGRAIGERSGAGECDSTRTGQWRLVDGELRVRWDRQCTFVDVPAPEGDEDFQWDRRCTTRRRCRPGGAEQVLIDRDELAEAIAERRARPPGKAFDIEGAGQFIILGADGRATDPRCE